MFRGPQILTHCGPIRPLLLRDSHLATLSEHTCSGWQGATGGSWSSAVLPYVRLTRGVCHLTSRAPAKPIPTFKECTRVEERSLKPESVNNQGHSFSKTTCNHHRRPWDIFWPSHSFTSKTHGQHLVRSFSFGPQLHQSRPIHQAHPRVSDTWRDCLSAENESRCRQSLEPNLKFYELENGRKGGAPAQGKNQGRWASVLVSLCCVAGEPAFLFTLRSSTLKGRHKGDVSFAGGKSDPSDMDVVATALREAREELGVTVATKNVWGVLKPLRDMSGMLVAPVLANFGPLEKLSFKPNPGEVEEIFTLSLSHLCNPQNRGYTHFRTGDKYGYTLPVFRNGKHRVWGLTAVALDHTLKLVVPS